MLDVWLLCWVMCDCKTLNWALQLFASQHANGPAGNAEELCIQNSRTGWRKQLAVGQKYIPKWNPGKWRLGLKPAVPNGPLMVEVMSDLAVAILLLASNSDRCEKADSGLGVGVACSLASPIELYCIVASARNPRQHLQLADHCFCFLSIGLCKLRVSRVWRDKLHFVALGPLEGHGRT